MSSFKVFSPVTGVTRRIAASADAAWEDVEQQVSCRSLFFNADVPAQITYLVVLVANLVGLQIRTIFAFPPTDVIAVTYADHDGDVVTISTTQEFRELVSSSTSVKFVVTTLAPNGKSSKSDIDLATPKSTVEAKRKGDRTSVREDDNATRKEEEEWVLEQVPPSEAVSGEHVNVHESESTSKEDAEVTSDRDAPKDESEKVRRPALSVNILVLVSPPASELQQTTLEDITASEETAYPSVNGAVDQKSILEPAEKQVEAKEEATAEKKAAGESQRTTAVDSDKDAGKKAVDDSGEKAGTGQSAKNGDSTSEESTAEEELAKDLEELLSATLPTAFSYLSHLSRAATELERYPTRHRVYAYRPPVYAYRSHPLGPLGFVHPLALFGRPDVAGAGSGCGRREAVGGGCGRWC
ncbi:hypothetical protein HDU93_007497 [Gonapodya sp. JEL0774]|nr:hypothetical protein HDU93_007497 [Gonapodya sp. JEL0774]